MTAMDQKRVQMASGQGFIAALDQSGGSTPKALALYGVTEDSYEGEAAMFAEMHAMRARIIKAPGFTSGKVIGAILFERTMREQIDGTPVPTLLWDGRGIVPFLKIDKGLEAEADGVQMMKPIPGLEETLAEAAGLGVFGTKERSVIHSANAAGIAAVASQQFEVAHTVIAGGLVPIVEPEVNINAPDKAEAEALLVDALMSHVDALPDGQQVMLKLTIPTEAGLYDALADHPGVMRVVALSGGYSTEEACAKLAQNSKMIASFSRALTEGLQRSMSDADFAAAIGANIDQIHAASVA
ncbi:MAG: fructose bisphosphate aldolase [Pseudomonadota bacterium]